MGEAMKRGVAHQVGADGRDRVPREFAVDRVNWILANHHPEPLDAVRQSELDRILAAADRELRKE